MTLIRTLLLLAVVVAPTSSWACSPRSIDTAEQLVQGASGIYHVRVSSVQSGRRLEFKVIATLKGERKSSLRVPGALISKQDPNDHPAPYTFVRPGGRGGNCFAVTYNRNQQYLLFFKNGSPYWSPLAPTNEQVSGPADAWLIWVKRQLAQPVNRGAA